ncbi:MAG: hypothetical protein PUK78_00015 [Spirochaetales bacterium]|nr:hypothetical protein [Spirochaetia bacterium]MDD7458275.1 hypothetical protein [Spirochaetales bacterium]
MKKTLIAVAAAAALTTSAFAEITFGAWLRALAAPIAHNGEDAIVAYGNSWGWGARTARLDINGVSEDGKVGFSMGVFNDMDDGLGMGDRAVIWAKPIDQVKLSIGKFDSPDNGLRGDLCYGSWNWLRPYNWLYDGEGLTFDGIWRKGLMAEVDPIEGLHMFAVIPMSKDYAKAGEKNPYVKYQKAEDAYKNIQAGFGYTIDGIGKIKAQYIGDYTEVTVDGKDETATTGQVGVAFDLTAVENLYVTVGARFGIADKDYCDAGYLKMAYTAGVSYQVTDQFKVSADGGVKMTQDDSFGKADDPDDMAFFAGAGIDFAVADGVNLAADVRFINTGRGEEGDDNSISFLVGVTKSISSNGYIGVAFQGSTNGAGLINNGWDNAIAPAGEKGDDLVWAIPVAISCWF